MKILTDLLGRVKAVQKGLEDGSLIRDVVKNYPDEIMQMQYEQLFSGKGNDGKDLRPFYSEDLQPAGYFKTVESAKRYADWKQGLTYPMKGNRNPDAPNLYITGKFHSEIGVVFGNKAVGVEALTPYALEIMSKYGVERFGLSGANWRELFVTFGAQKDLLNLMKSML